MTKFIGGEVVRPLANTDFFFEEIDASRTYRVDKPLHGGAKITDGCGNYWRFESNKLALA